MKGITKILLVALSFTLMATQCERVECCDKVVAKTSLAAGWCTLTIDYCDGTTDEFPVDEVVYDSYNIGDCYP